MHQEKAFAKTNLYYNQLLNLIVACKKYKRARGHLACTPALLRRLYWVEAVEARAFQELPHMRYSAWTEKVLGSDYKYKTEARKDGTPEAAEDDRMYPNPHTIVFTEEYDTEEETHEV